MASYIKHIPPPLLADLVGGRWLPIVGAGFSRNAVAPDGKSVPGWADLAKLLAKELPHFRSSGPIDTISTYEDEYSRARLVERVADLLMINEVGPGGPHAAFCKIPFDRVVTTNFDFLLERQYEGLGQTCLPLVQENQLAIRNPHPGPVLMKLHGDLHHPDRLVLTERDFDTWIERNKLFATAVGNLLIERTPVLVGYSLDDPDLRQLALLIRDRLGELANPMYAIRVGDRTADIKRFARRGVRVISLPATPQQYGAALETLFNELSDYWQARIVDVARPTEERVLSELSLPRSSETRLLYVAAPLDLLPLYKENIFPLALEMGLVPVSSDDVVAPEGARRARLQALLERARLAIVDATSPRLQAELRVVVATLGPENVLAVAELGELLVDAASLRMIHRSAREFDDPEDLIGRIRTWLAERTEGVALSGLVEPRRLLGLGLFGPAVVSAVAALEQALRQRFGAQGTTRPLPLSSLVRAAVGEQVIDARDLPALTEAISARNAVLHTGREIDAVEANELITAVLRVIADVQG